MRAAKGEFSAAAVGSYERGERLMSVSRLNRLARIYRVPVDQLLPADAPRRRADTGDRLVIDLPALEERHEPEWQPLRRFAEAIQTRRGDFGGKMLSLRGGDLLGLAVISGLDVESMKELIGRR